MKWFTNMKIGKKLIISFLLVAIFSGIVGFVGYLSATNMQNNILPAVQYALTIDNNAIGVITGERGLINDRMTETALREAQYGYIQSCLANVAETMAAYELIPKTNEEQAIWEQIKTAHTAWLPYNEKVVSLAKQRDELVAGGTSEEAAAVTKMDDQVYNASLDSRTYHQKLDGLLGELVTLINENAKRTTENATMMILIFACSSVIISLLLGILISRSISRPLGATVELARALASGELDKTIHIQSKDEAGQLAATIDREVRNAFKNIAQAQVISEKQSRYQSEQVNKLVVNLERLAKGELYCDMAVSEADGDTQEIYKLFKNISDNLHMSIDTIKGYIDDISRVLGEVSEKNLTVGISKEYRGNFVALKDSINGIVKSLNEVMLEINTSADQVASGTQQVSGGSQEISQGATEQASAIEELTTSVTQIAEQTKLNAASANEANKLTNGAKGNAEQGNEQMKAMQQAMADINESSENISKIIKVIDDIAFQTNILALNAAVEAARAGAHGKGFAVVAEEVRNLAARSANAAKETTDLIEGSIRNTEAGTKIADETAEALINIVSGVEKAAQLVGEIASASNEQASAIAQVNNGIEQMSQVVQTNSATSEETAAAAEELSSQAEMLKDMVGQFRLKSGDTDEEEIEAAEESAQPDKPHISLSDEDFGKY